MKIVFKKPEGLDTNKRVYTCSACGNLFNWNSQSSWFGSQMDLENNPENIIFACSDNCQYVAHQKSKG